MISIDTIDAFRLRLPLKQPYENALGTLSHLNAILYRIVDSDGREGWGEACPVVGYSPETPDEAWDATQAIVQLMASDPDKGQAAVDRLMATHPFVASALNEAMADVSGLFDDAWKAVGHRPVELLGTVNTLDPQAAPRVALDLIGAGYRTLKVKVGYEPDSDAQRVRNISAVIGDGVRMRIDANQGYNVDDALAFARAVPPDQIEVFEQPVHQKDWEGIASIAVQSPLPIMLDESIYTDDDIRRAASIAGVTAIKLKMSKAGGPVQLRDQVALGQALGLGVVIGNGVASDLGCYHEALLQSLLGLERAGEMNGFTKPTMSVLSPPLRLDGPSLIFPRGAVPRIERDLVADLAIATATGRLETVR
jgi:o-succinylbenzoate synthase